MIARRTSRRVKPNGKRTSRGFSLHDAEEQARRAGWTVDRTSGGRMMFRPPDRSSPTVYASESGDPHSLMNVRSALRRSGLDVSASRRIRRNGDDSNEWHEVGRYTDLSVAVNALISRQMSGKQWLMKLEEMPSRSRQGETSFAVFVRERPDDLTSRSLDELEEMYVLPSSPRRRR